MTTRQIRILHTSIDVPFSTAYAFTCKPENFPQWAAGLSSGLTHTAQGWVAETPAGDAAVRFTEPNELGVLDHWVDLPGKPTVYIPLRMFENGDGTEVELVLIRQPEMTDADFARDAHAIETDLASLKRLLEHRE